MNIFFLGIQSIYTSHYASADSRRIEALAHLLAEQGHHVHIFTAMKAAVRTIGRIIIHYRPSFNPQSPGGFLPILLSLLSLWRHQPHVVHIHGWRAALLVRIAALFSPHSTYIWTISALPSQSRPLAKFIAWQARSVADAVTTPSRQLQYQLLTDFNLPTSYIPDGYTPEELPVIPAKQWKLRKEQYCVALTNSLEEIRWIVQSYRKVKTRKKLVFVHPWPTEQMYRLVKRHAFAEIFELPAGRATSSLISQSAAVIAGAPAFGNNLLLQAMEHGLPIITTTDPLNEETVGTTAQIIKMNDVQGLEKALRSVISKTTNQVPWGQKVKRSMGALKPRTPRGAGARKRARTHFTWSRIAEEYGVLYRYPVVRKVFIDSIIPKPTWNISA